MEILKQSLEHLDTGNLLGARDTDIRFLKDILENPVISSLAHLTESLDVLNSRRSDQEPAKPVFQLGLSLIYSIRSVCFRLATYNRYACELCNILDNPHILAVMDAHDHVASKNYGDDDRDIIKESDSIESDEPNEETPNAFKIVGISKKDDEPLGMTFRVENDHIVIARILCGGLVDRQGLLHVGDTILEVNGRPVSTHQQLLEQLRLSHDIVTLKIVPSFQESIASAPCYMRALYNYDPLSDTLLPCKEIGIAFKSGDILEVRNQEDPNWWQARRTDIDDPPIGLIPSQELEEKRKAFVRPEFDYATKTTICGTKVTKKKRKEMYQIQANNYFDKAELTLYEEVCRIPPFERKTLVLVGAQGVGRRTLKSKLINYDPQRFATPLPHTSRPIREGEQDGKVYHFVKKEIMEQDIADHKYLEWGQFDGHLYGTKLDSIRAINQSGRMCVLDCNPQCLKVLKTAEFMPFVVFIAAPPLDQLRFMHEWGRSHSSANRTMTLDRALGRHSRRTRTLQSLASFCEDEDLQATIEESARLQRTYEKKFDMILVNNNFERTFEDLREALEALSTEPQWVPLSWVFSE